jgi:hypothetical protein
MFHIIPINLPVLIPETSHTVPVAVRLPINSWRSFVPVAGVDDGVSCTAVDAFAVDFGAHVVCIGGFFVECLPVDFCCMLFSGMLLVDGGWVLEER